MKSHQLSQKKPNNQKAQPQSQPRKWASYAAAVDKSYVNPLSMFSMFSADMPESRAMQFKDSDPSTAAYFFSQNFILKKDADGNKINEIERPSVSDFLIPRHLVNTKDKSWGEQERKPGVPVIPDEDLNRLGVEFNKDAYGAQWHHYSYVTVGDNSQQKIEEIVKLLQSHNLRVYYTEGGECKKVKDGSEMFLLMKRDFEAGEAIESGTMIQRSDDPPLSAKMSPFIENKGWRNRTDTCIKEYLLNSKNLF